MKATGTVAAQEFRVRLRTGRWRWLLVAWVVVIGGFSVLLRLGLAVSHAPGPIGLPMFGGLMLFVLGLALLVAPALTAQSINGDRERGTLATVQVTRLSATEIASGKLLAAWCVVLVFLVLTLPFVVWAILEGGVGVGRAAVVIVTVAVLTGVVCALAQALSALFARGITATLMSYVLVFALTVGTLISFGLGTALTTRTERTEISGQSPSRDASYASYETQPHPERVWWLLAPNPFVILADSAPPPPLRVDPDTGDVVPATMFDPLSVVGTEVRAARQSPEAEFDPDALSRPFAVWPYGLAFDLLLGAGAVWISAHRLRTPVRRLGRGVRIA